VNSDNFTVTVTVREILYITRVATGKCIAFVMVGAILVGDGRRGRKTGMSLLLVRLDMGVVN
jgi:hypothetical protein